MLFSDEPLFTDVDAIEDLRIVDHRADFRDGIIERDGACVCW